MKKLLSILLCLCVALSAQSWFVFSAALYQRYNQKLENVLTFVEHQTDAVDLDRCINTGVMSAKYASSLSAWKVSSFSPALPTAR